MLFTNSFFRFSKGIIALLGIQLFALGTILTIQSCQNDGDAIFVQEQKNFTEDFKSILINNKRKLESLALRNENLIVTRGNSTTEGREILEKEAQKILNPLVQKTKELLKVYDIDDNFLKTEFGNVNAPEIALVGLAFFSQKKEDKIAMNFLDLLGTPAFASAGWFDCVKDALGAKEIMDIADAYTQKGLSQKAMKKILKKAVRKAAKKMASKFLGHVGAAIMIYDFGECMKWWTAAKVPKEEILEEEQR